MLLFQLYIYMSISCSDVFFDLWVIVKKIWGNTSLKIQQYKIIYQITFSSN